MQQRTQWTSQEEWRLSVVSAGGVLDDGTKLQDKTYYKKNFMFHYDSFSTIR